MSGKHTLSTHTQKKKYFFLRKNLTSQTCPYLRIGLGPAHVAQSPSPLTQPKTKQNKKKIK
jgi:hypothetical protein